MLGLGLGLGFCFFIFVYKLKITQFIFYQWVMCHIFLMLDSFSIDLSHRNQNLKWGKCHNGCRKTANEALYEIYLIYCAVYRLSTWKPIRMCIWKKKFFLANESILILEIYLICIFRGQRVNTLWHYSKYVNKK